GGRFERAAVPVAVMGFDVGAAVEEQPDGVRASGVGSEMEGGAAPIAAAALDGEAEVEHERDRGGVAVLGGTHDRGALIVAQSGYEAGIVGELPPCRAVVGLEAGREELVGGGCMVVCGVAAQQVGQLGA